jgi:N-acetylneuraminic acid mutarotase
MSAVSCPPENKGLIATWTGERLMVFGGRGNSAEDGFYSYDPVSNTWEELRPIVVLAQRSHGFAEWVDNRMTIWGGLDDVRVPMNDGAAFDANAQSWVPLPPTGALTARSLIPFVGGWSARAGDRLLVIGGGVAAALHQDGAIYAPRELAQQQWSAIPSWNPPGEHRAGVGVWTETEFIVWGGWNGSEPMVGGSRWMP